MADVGASYLARLRNRSESSGIPYQQCLLLFFQEEFLRRLSRSSYADKLVLKGGLFIYALTDFSVRTTVDIDFLLRHMRNDIPHMQAVIESILAIPTEYDDIILLTLNKIENILLHKEYTGTSAQIIGRMKNVRVPFDIDIGFGDVVVPQARSRIIRTQLAEFDAPEILTYSLESTIAEKFDAILQRFELTSRMKDFFDIYHICHSFDFRGTILKDAILQTLEHRGTPFDQDSLRRIVTLSENSDMQIRWKNFQRTIFRRDPAFAEVIETLDCFLHPVWDAICTHQEFTGRWSADSVRWI